MKLEINQGYTTMHGQPVIKMRSLFRGLVAWCMFLESCSNAVLGSADVPESLVATLKLRARRMTCSKFHTEYTQISTVTEHSLVACATWRLAFVHRWCW